MALKYTLMVFAVVTALGQIGYDITSLIAGLGIAGIALGFAAKDTLSNIVAGIFIFWDRPFYIGDLVEIEDEYGEVQEITLRTTRIVTPDGRMVSIPNQNIAANKIISYTMFPNLRLDMDVTIGVEEPIEKSRQEMLKIVKGDEDFWMILRRLFWFRNWAIFTRNCSFACGLKILKRIFRFARIA